MSLYSWNLFKKVQEAGLQIVYNSQAPFVGISFPCHFVGISFPLNEVGMKFRHNDMGISFPCFWVGTAMHGNRKSIPTTDFNKYGLRKSKDLSEY